MSNLDLQYIAELVPQAQAGDSNAFAELFAATYQKQFAFARSYLKDDFLAQEALQDAYIHALKNLSALREASLVVVWLNQLTLRACFRVQHRSGAMEHPENRILDIDGKPCSVRRIMSLPFSEAQAILLGSLCGMRTGSIASLLEIIRSAVRGYQESGRRHLRMLSGGREGA